MNIIVPERGIPKEDLAKIKKHCFPQTSFWVTETRSVDELSTEGGVLVSNPHKHAANEVCEAVSAG